MEKTTVLSRERKLLIKVLTKLQPYRNLAPGILALVESGYVDEKTIDGIIILISKSLKNIKDKKQQKALQSWLKAIKKIHEQEEKEKKEENIDQLLENI